MCDAVKKLEIDSNHYNERCTNVRKYNYSMYHLYPTYIHIYIEDKLQQLQKTKYKFIRKINCGVL